MGAIISTKIFVTIHAPFLWQILVPVVAKWVETKNVEALKGRNVIVVSYGPVLNQDGNIEYARAAGSSRADQ